LGFVDQGHQVIQADLVTGSPVPGVKGFDNPQQPYGRNLCANFFYKLSPDGGRAGFAKLDVPAWESIAGLANRPLEQDLAIPDQNPRDPVTEDFRLSFEQDILCFHRVKYLFRV
jgi:hypothetical protein